MEKPILKDKGQYPTKEIIYSCIGDTKILWDSLFDHIHENHPDFSEEWRYYKDGMSWLLKVTRKKKTIFWLAVLQDTFRITFYFTDKAEEDINSSDISEELKEQFKNGKRYNKIRGLTIKFSDDKDVEYAKCLIPIRIKK